MRGILTRKSFQSSLIRRATILLLVASVCEFGVTQSATAPAPPSTSSQSPQPSTNQSSPPAGAQNPAEQKSSDDKGADNGEIPRIRVGINEVNVVFTVTDKHGKRVTDLKQSDFRFVDDNKPATEIRSFHAETNLPLQVALLIDASNSVRDRFKFEQESAIEFLNQTLRRGHDEAMVVGFDVTPEVTQDFTDDTEKLDRGVRALRPGGGTAMYDALYYACRDKLLKEPMS